MKGVLSTVLRSKPIQVMDVPLGATAARASEVPKGGVLPSGDIVVFARAAESIADVIQTIFHAFFHPGNLPPTLW